MQKVKQELTTSENQQKQKAPRIGGFNYLSKKMYKLIHRHRIIYPFGPFINAAGEVGNRFKILVG